MAGTSDLIALGFGSWSTVARVPTLGFAIATPTPPADGGLEWALQDSRLEWAPDGPAAMEYALTNTRLEWATEAPN